MILSVRMDNFMAYEQSAELSLFASDKIKKFGSNVLECGKMRVLKSACIYGANNAGKTCVLRAVAAIKAAVFGDYRRIVPNVFSDRPTCSLGISFVEGEAAYSYDVSFDCSDKITVTKERFALLGSESLARRNGKAPTGETLADGKVPRGETLVERDGKAFYLNGKAVGGEFDDGKIFIYALPLSLVKAYRDILVGFMDKIDVLTLDDIPIEKTLDVLKENSLLREKTIGLIRLADIDVDDYRYLDGTAQDAPRDEDLKDRDEMKDHAELALKNRDDDPKDHAELAPKDRAELAPKNRDDDPKDHAELALKNLSGHGSFNSFNEGKSLSFIYDSTGTKKLIALSSYIVEALMNGRVLVVDELDSSLHFKLTRAIVALFNNELSTAQLIFSAHDINLLDCKKLLRYDQVWFAAKKDGSAVLYPLSELMEGRTDTDVIEGYKAGLYGALPSPDFITLLLRDIKDDDDDEEE